MGNILRIDKSHLNSCALLHMNVFNNEPWNECWTKSCSYKRLKDIYNSPNFVGYVYEVDGKVKASLFGNYEQMHDGKYYYLKEMFVDDEIKKMGIGSKLLKELEKDLREIPIKYIFLLTSRSNKTSIFYLKNEYIPVIEMIMMAKDI